MTKQIIYSLLIFCCVLTTKAQTPLPIKQLLQAPCMGKASFSLTVKDLEDGKTVYSYEADQEMIPASVMKTITTAAALELLGADYRFPTSIEYDGKITDGILQGNLYIRGSGDPSLGSSHFDKDRNKFVHLWITALKKAGIQGINGAVIADESIFDTEGISSKWIGEDMGNYYGAGSYGLSIFDNLYKLYMKTGVPGSRPTVKETDPEVPSIRFHNYLRATPGSSDSAYISGGAFAVDRYLYGSVPANQDSYMIKGDIPDPALFLAQYLTRTLEQEGIHIKGVPSCFRILSEEGKWKVDKKTVLITTYSPTLAEIVSVTNHVSHNLFADALIKTLGLAYKPGKNEVISSFGRGIQVICSYWKEKGLDTSELIMYDGGGLAPSSKVSTGFIGDLLVYMATQSKEAETFKGSLPYAGTEGSVRNFLKGTSLQGKAQLKSGGMSRVKTYAGYITKDRKEYAIAVFVNNYTCSSREMTRALERLLLDLF